jgi:hypothetical protein
LSALHLAEGVEDYLEGALWCQVRQLPLTREANEVEKRVRVVVLWQAPLDAPPEELGEGLHLWLSIIQEPMKKERTNGDDSSTDDFSSEPEEEISSEEEMNLQQPHSDDGDTSDSEKNDSIRNNSDTSDDGSDNEEDQFSDDEFD